MDGLEIAIDHGELHRNLKDVGEYLAELMYIDLALAHVDERNAYWELQRPDYGPGDYAEMRISLGTQFPFQTSISLPTRASQEVEQQLLDALAVQANEWVADQMEHLSSRIQEIMHYPLDGYAFMDGYLEKVWSVMDSELWNDFGYLGSDIDDWNGIAASDFKYLFYGKYEQVLGNQKQLVRSLQGALAASRRTVEYSQQSVINAVAAARDALLDQLRLRSVDNQDSSNKRIALLAVGGAATVLATLTTGLPLWVAAGSATIGFSASVAATELPEEATEGRPITGRSAEDLYIWLFVAVRDVDVFLDQNLDQIHDQLKVVNARIWSLHKEHATLPKRPDLVGGVSSTDFYHETR